MPAVDRVSFISNPEEKAQDENYLREVVGHIRRHYAVYQRWRGLTDSFKSPSLRCQRRYGAFKRPNKKELFSNKPSNAHMTRNAEKSNTR
jgi:hypothetical protein